MADLTTVAVPDIGDFTDIPVIEVLVAPGDEIAQDDPLITLESDKATMEIPSPAAGVVREIVVAIGDQVSEGTPILMLEASGNGAGPAAAEAEGGAPDGAPPPDGAGGADVATAAAATAEDAAATGEPAGAAAVGDGEGAAADDGRRPYASPTARRVARALGVDLAAVTGTARLGRITKADVEAAAAGAGAAPAPTPSVGAAGSALPGLAPWPQVDFAKYGEIERVPLTRIQKIAGPNLARNWALIPHVTHDEDADITDLEAFRRQVNADHPETKVTMVALLLKACVASLKAFPVFNASLDGEELVLKRYHHLGFAADTPNGLVVPVIRDVDQKGLLEIATELRELSGKAREGRLGLGDMQGGTFTISSLGGIGGTSFTPIVNAPEVAILGVTRSAMKPVWDGAQFVPRLIVPLSLSYDHRVIDGAAAARFMVHLAGVLSDMRRVLL